MQVNWSKDNILIDNFTICGKVDESFEEFFDAMDIMSERRHECQDVTAGACWES